MTATRTDTRSPSHLPDPDEYPGRHVVLFDGHCRFCQSQVRKLQWFDTGRRLTFLSLHDPRVGQRYPDLSHEQLMEQMYVIDPAGGKHAGASAIRYLSRQLPTLWLLVPLLHLPCSLPWWRWLYGQIARRRYRWGRQPSCDDGACEIHLNPGRRAPAQPALRADLSREPKG